MFCWIWIHNTGRNRYRVSPAVGIYINLFNLESLGNADVMRSNSVRSNDGEEAAGDQVS